MGVGLGGSVENCSTCQRRIRTFDGGDYEKNCGLLPSAFAVVIALFATVIRRKALGLVAQAALDQERYYRRLVAQAVGHLACVQSFINIGVNMACLLPTKD